MKFNIELAYEYSTKQMQQMPNSNRVPNIIKISKL